jgi:hypothetical protein
VVGEADRVAFLFNNGPKYLIAQVTGLTEFLVEWYFLPHTKEISVTTYGGIFLSSASLT